MGGHIEFEEGICHDLADSMDRLDDPPAVVSLAANVGSV
jgi:hypothetical protein